MNQMPLDTTGVAVTNNVTNEQQILSGSNSPNYYFIVPQQGPFYETGLTVSIVLPNKQLKQLTYGVDYLPCFKFIGASRATTMPVFGGISILNTNITGTVSLNYQSLGGNYVLTQTQINTILSDYERNPLTTTWEEITGLPNDFPPTPHPWKLQDMVGLSEVVGGLSQIAQALQNQSEVSTPLVQAINITAKDTVGLGNVDNFQTASIPDTLAGTSNTEFVTPLGVASKVALELQKFTNDNFATGPIFVGPTRAFTNINDAWNSLEGKIINTPLVIQVDDGNYDCGDSINFTVGNPYADLISILGNVANPSNVVLNFEPSAGQTLADGWQVIGQNAITIGGFTVNGQTTANAITESGIYVQDGSVISPAKSMIFNNVANGIKCNNGSWTGAATFNNCYNNTVLATNGSIVNISGTPNNNLNSVSTSKNSLSVSNTNPLYSTVPNGVMSPIGITADASLVKADYAVFNLSSATSNGTSGINGSIGLYATNGAEIIAQGVTTDSTYNATSVDEGGRINAKNSVHTNVGNNVALANAKGLIDISNSQVSNVGSLVIVTNRDSTVIAENTVFGGVSASPALSISARDSIFMQGATFPGHVGIVSPIVTMLLDSKGNYIDFVEVPYISKYDCPTYNTLEWNVQNAVSVSISPALGTVNSSGSSNSVPYGNYTITATNPSGTSTKVVHVTSVYSITYESSQNSVTNWNINGGTTNPVSLPPGTYPINAGVIDQYTFAGWVCTGGVSVADPTNPNTTFTVVDNAAEYLIQSNWTLDTYSISLSGLVAGWSCNGNENNPQVLPKGSYPLFSGNYAEHTFNGWQTTGGCSVTGNGQNATLVVNGTSNGTVSGSWTLINYPVNISNVYPGWSLNGSQANPNNLPAGQYNLNAGTRAGYNFTGWTVSGSGSVSNNNANTTLTVNTNGTGVNVAANWTLITYPISLSNLHNGWSLNGDGTDAVQNLAPGAYPLSAGVYPGYSFSGWTVNGSVTVDDPSNPNTTLHVTGTGSVSGNWTLITYPVTINSNGGNSWEVNGNESDPDVLPPGTYPISAGNKAGYTFAGWSVGGGVTVDNASSPTANITVTGAGTLTMNWNLTTYNVNLLSNGSSGWLLNGTENDPQKLTAGTYPVAAGTLSGYGFAGWSTSGGISVDNANSANANITVTGDGTITANWSVNTFQVSFNSNGSSGWSMNGSEANPQQLPLGTYPINAGTLSGYKFNGWTFNGSVGCDQPGSVSANMTVSGAGTAIANWSLITYTVTLSNFGGGWTFNGTENNPPVLPPGTYPVTYGNPPSEQLFSSWTVTGGVTVDNPNSANANVTITGNGTLTANTVTKQYTVSLSNLQAGWTFNNNENNPETVPAGTYPINAGTAPSGYIFGGWTVTGGVTVDNPNSATANAIVTANGTLTGNWTRVYNLTINPSNCSSWDVSGYPSNQTTYQLPAGTYNISATAANGYNFSSWGEVANGVSYIGTPGQGYPNTTVVIGGDFTISPTASPNTVNVNIACNGGGGSTTVTINGQSTTSQETLSLAPGQYTISASTSNGWTFNGWSINSPNASIANTSAATTTLTISSGGDVSIDGMFNLVNTAYVTTEYNGGVSIPVVRATDSAGNPTGGGAYSTLLTLSVSPGTNTYAQALSSYVGSNGYTYTFTGWTYTNCIISSTTSTLIAISQTVAQANLGSSVTTGVVANYTATAPSGGGGGNGGGCVHVDSFLSDGIIAGDVRAGDTLELADEVTLEPCSDVVAYSERKLQPSVIITTENGVTLHCSTTAPIPTKDGLVKAPLLLGKEVPTRIDNSDGTNTTEWSVVKEVVDGGDIYVQHIFINNQCFWAGKNTGKYILHHNANMKA